MNDQANAVTPLDAFLEEVGEEENIDSLFDFPLDPSAQETKQAVSTSPAPIPSVSNTTEVQAEDPQTPEPQQLSFGSTNSGTDPMKAALERAAAQSNARLLESLKQVPAKIVYGRLNEDISDRDITFEGLRQQYEVDYPELSDSKKVSWSVTYGKITKNVQNPGSDKIYDLKAEIEKSKKFMEELKKGKKDEKSPTCMVKPRVTAQSKGEAKLPPHKAICIDFEDAVTSEKPIVYVPSKDGHLYELRKTPVGTFVAPAANLSELPLVGSSFIMKLPKIPLRILSMVENFFREVCQRWGTEALVHIVYDTTEQRYKICVPEQRVTRASVAATIDEYPDNLIHVMDVHSHDSMVAEFSTVDNIDEQATRLYGVIGHLDQVYPSIRIRASCGGKFIDLKPEDVFAVTKRWPESTPHEWFDKLTVERSLVIKPISALTKRCCHEIS